MSPSKLKLLSASLISVGIPQVFVSSLVAGVFLVISSKTAQIRMSCGSLHRDIMCTDTERYATALEFWCPGLKYVSGSSTITEAVNTSLFWSAFVNHCRGVLYMIYTDRTAFGVQLMHLLVIFDFVVCFWMNNICLRLQLFCPLHVEID